MEAWGLEVWLRWHSLSLWLLPQAHCHSSPTSWLTVHPQTTISFRHTWQLGHHSLEMDVPEFLPTKQPFWDRLGVLVDKALVEASLNSPHSRASFLAASSQHSGDWLFALPIASCMWIKVRRRGSQSCGWFEARAGSVRPAWVSLQFYGWRTRGSQLCLQEDPRQDN